MSSIAHIASLVNGASFVGIDTETVVKLTGGKKNPMQGRVTKVTTGANVMAFQNKNCNAYENMVNRRLDSEGNGDKFEVGPRKWGTRVDNLPLVEHKGALYFELIFNSAGETSYKLDGVAIAKDAIEGLPVRRASSGQGGLKDTVIIRTFKVASLTAVRIDGQEFTNITA